MFGHKCSRIRQVTSSSLSWSVTPWFCSSNIRICFLLMAQDGCISSSCRIQAFFFLFFLYPIGRYLVTWLYLPLRETGKCLHSIWPCAPLASGLVFLMKEERMSIRERFMLSAPCRNRPFTVEIRTANFKSKLTRNFLKQIKIFLNWQKQNAWSRLWKHRFSYERFSGMRSNKAT